MKLSLAKKNRCVLLGVTSLMFASMANHAEDAKADISNPQLCPQEFHSLPLYPEAKMCLVFGQTLPATMTYYASTDQQTTQLFYTEQLGEADSIKTAKGRIQMEYDNANKIIMISKDGAGTQIDVLVKS